jgi:hypothetical protein
MSYMWIVVKFDLFLGVLREMYSLHGSCSQTPPFYINQHVRSLSVPFFKSIYNKNTQKNEEEELPCKHRVEWRENRFGSGDKRTDLSHDHYQRNLSCKTRFSSHIWTHQNDSFSSFLSEMNTIGYKCVFNQRFNDGMTSLFNYKLLIIYIYKAISWLFSFINVELYY